MTIARAIWWDTLRQDVRYAVRGFRRSPSFTVMVVATLALGIGANAALFSLADRLFLSQPAGVTDPARLRRLYARSNWSIGDVTIVRDVFGYPAFQAIKQTIGDRARVIAYTPPDSLRIGEADAAISVRGSYATSDFLPVLGARPILGRVFTADEDRMGEGALVAVIGNALWRNRFGGDTSVIGRVAIIARQRYTIIGVMPDGFTGVDLDPADVWLPAATMPGRMLGSVPWYAHWRSGWQFRVMARVEPGTSSPWISSVATTALRRGEIENVPRHPDTASVLVGPLLAALGPSITPKTEVAIATRLIGVVVIVLIIACANVANLLLARALKRRREIAVRLALGMSRRRLVAQLFIEGLCLSFVASIAAIVAGVWGGAALRRAVLPETEWGNTALDWRIVAVSLALAFVTGLLASLSPVLRATRPDLTSALKAGSRERATDHSRLRSGLVVVQAALSVILLVGAGLFIRSLGSARGIDLGLDAGRIIYATVQFVNAQTHSVENRPHMQDMFRGLTSAGRRIEQLPGVERSALATAPPMGGYVMAGLFLAGGRPVPRLDNRDPALVAVTPSYFAAAGTRVARGRVFGDADDIGSEPVMVVNETAARAYWPDRDAIGQCVFLFAATAPCTRVIGVMRDAHYDELVETPMAGLYVSVAQQRGGFLATPAYLVIRVAPAAAARVAESARRILRETFPSAEPPAIQFVSDRVASQLRPWRLGASLFSVFGLLAVIVAAVGVYSVVSYSVEQRTHEMGVRVALGAQRGQVVSLVIGQGMLTVSLGILLGVAATLALGPLVASMLYGVSPRDPVVLAAVAAGLAMIAALASAVPAWRAARTDPAIALRAD